MKECCVWKDCNKYPLPTDGRYVMMYSSITNEYQYCNKPECIDGNHICAIGEWNKHNGIWNGSIRGFQSPTHWMEIPKCQIN